MVCLEKLEIHDYPKEIPLNKISNWLRELCLLNNPDLTNDIFELIVDNCFHLVKLEIGGKPKEYNPHITLDGIQILWGSDFNYHDDEEDYRIHKGLRWGLVWFKIEYCIKIGGKALEMICNRFWESLASLSIIRNYYEFSAKIPDEALINFKNWHSLTHLEIVYCRNFDYDWIRNFSMYCKNLRYLNIQDCPVQESLEPLAEGCPYLEELNMGGDSWISENALVGLFQHKNLKIFHLGHFEHADIECVKTDVPVNYDFKMNKEIDNSPMNKALNEAEKGKYIGKLLQI